MTNRAVNSAPSASSQTPQRLRVVPDLPGDLAPCAQVRIKVERARGVSQIPVDLGPGREEAGPVPVRCEGELVPQRRDVDGQSGIVVVAPGPAEVVAPFEDHEVGDAVSPQQVAARDTAGSGSDDGDLVCRFSHETPPSTRRRRVRKRTGAPRESCTGSHRWAVTARNSTAFAQSIRLPARDPPRLRLHRVSTPRVPAASTTRWNASSGHRRRCAAAAPGCFR